jgi:GAF domain-containing protein
MRDRPGEPISTPAALRALAGIIAGDSSQDAVLRRTCDVTKTVISGAASVSVTVLDGAQPRTAAASDDLALNADEVQYASDSGPCLDAVRQMTTVLVPDMDGESRWPAYVARTMPLGVRGSLSLPLGIEEGVVGALNIYATSARAFDEEAVELATDLAEYAGIVATTADQYNRATTLVDQMQRAMESRAVIEQAKGILMAQRHCTAEEAFEVLVRLSQETHRKLRELAEALVVQVVEDQPGNP